MGKEKHFKRKIRSRSGGSMVVAIPTAIMELMQLDEQSYIEYVVKDNGAIEIIKIEEEK